MRDVGGPPSPALPPQTAWGKGDASRTSVARSNSPLSARNERGGAGGGATRGRISIPAVEPHPFTRSPVHPFTPSPSHPSHPVTQSPSYVTTIVAFIPGCGVQWKGKEPAASKVRWKVPSGLMAPESQTLL